MAPGGSRLTYEQREVGQSQESVAWKSGQRARDVFESSRKQTQFFSYTHYNHTYVQSARMWKIGTQRISIRKKRPQSVKRVCW